MSESDSYTILTHLFFRSAGRILRNAKTTKRATDWNDSASVVDVNCCKVVPACIAMNEGGATPKKLNKYQRKF